MNFVIPLVVVLVFTYGAVKKVNLFDSFVKGAKNGLKTSVSLLPVLIGLMLIVNMLSSSGAIDFLSYLISPVCSFFNIPSQIIPIAILRPFSGSGAISMLENLFNSVPVDGKLGIMASVLVCCSETTFYTLTVYFGSANITKTRYALPAALIGDFTAMILSVYTVNLLCG